MNLKDEVYFSERGQHTGNLKDDNTLEYPIDFEVQ
ncbi:hypothetical protein ymoll0001_20000, partial [Yersinia mollaretii ATCC 43969]